MLLLLDTDIFAYQATTSAETEVDLGGDIWSLTMDMQQAKDTFEAAVDGIKERLETNDVLCCMSDHAGNFRKQVWTDYKSNRRKTRKPVGYVAFCDWVRETYSTASRPMLEADDVMGIIATKPGNEGKVTIVSDDKDMKTIPWPPLPAHVRRAARDHCRRCRPVFPDTGPHRRHSRWVQRRARHRPEESRSNTWPPAALGAVEKAYIDAGLTRDDAIQQARLARILRWSDWHEGEPKLWTP